MRNGKRVPVKTSKKANASPGPKAFKGKCFRCDRTGHMGRDCPYTTKENGKPLNPKKAPVQNLEEEPDENSEDKECGILELSMLDTYIPPPPAPFSDPWVDGSDPWTGPAPFGQQRKLRMQPPSGPPSITPQELQELNKWLATPIQRTPPMVSQRTFILAGNEDDIVTDLEMDEPIVFEVVDDDFEVVPDFDVGAEVFETVVDNVDGPSGEFMVVDDDLDDDPSTDPNADPASLTPSTTDTSGPDRNTIRRRKKPLFMSRGQKKRARRRARLNQREAEGACPLTCGPSLGVGVSEAVTPECCIGCGCTLNFDSEEDLLQHVGDRRPDGDLDYLHGPCDNGYGSGLGGIIKGPGDLTDLQNAIEARMKSCDKLLALSLEHFLGEDSQLIPDIPVTKLASAIQPLAKPLPSPAPGLCVEPATCPRMPGSVPDPSAIAPSRHPHPMPNDSEDLDEFLGLRRRH